MKTSGNTVLIKGGGSGSAREVRKPGYHVRAVAGAAEGSSSSNARRELSRL